ncbi:MAG: hypothetical protein KY467_16460 [Gemmatimonadetes bacterium]|nr:hypothetical protein [Gemmatimonadota bacterium]
MACPTITLAGVTPDAWTCLRGRAAAMGVAVPPGDSGSIRHRDADAEYGWDAAAGTLAVTITRAPSSIGCAAVESRLRRAAAACGVS